MEPDVGLGPDDYKSTALPTELIRRILVKVSMSLLAGGFLAKKFFPASTFLSKCEKNR